MSTDSLQLDKLSFQEIVFTRWINYILLIKEVKIENLYSDLGNGIYIVYLIEALTFHEFKSKIKNPSFRTQKMENITMILKYLQDNELIKFLNIDSSNILNEESKIVLSFLWHIIEYFSIIKPLDIYFKNQHTKSTGKSTKQKFMSWLKDKVPATIRNIVSDCKNGRIIGALVNSCDPDLCSDWNKWQDKDDAINLRISMEIAEKKLGIPTLIYPDELENEKVDEKSMMLYLSQFLFYKSTFKAQDETETPQFKGLEKLSYEVNKTVCFSVYSINSNESLCVQYIDPCGDHALIMSKQKSIDVDENEAIYSFVPSIPGTYSLHIINEDNGTILVSSIISVVNEINYDGDILDHNCAELLDDQTYLEDILSFKGRGIQALGIRIGDHVEFTVHMLDNSKGSIYDISVKIKDDDAVPLHVQHRYDKETLVCSYSPLTVGHYEIIVLNHSATFQKVFLVHVGDKSITQIVAFGPGLSHASTTDPAVFVVETNGETGTLNFTIEGPNEAQIECTDNRDGSATVIYWPTTEGEYAVHILYENEDIQNSPFMVNVRNRDTSIMPSQVKAYGPALCEGHLTVGHVAHFTVDVSQANGRFDLLSVECFDRFGDVKLVNVISEGFNKRTYSLVPLKSVKLTLCISYDNICVSSSPYMIYVTENRLSNKIRVQGSGLQSAFTGIEAVFFVDCRLLSMDGKLDVVIIDSNLNPIPCSVDRTSKNLQIYSVKYIPAVNSARCNIEILYNNISVFDEPFSVPVANGSLLQTAKVNELSHGSDKLQDVEQLFDSLHDFSDIFLDPKAESYLRLVAPPDENCDNITLSDLPLPPADVTDDSGDTLFENMPSKFPLSTVLEESEENYSVKDSIFSSECHSRASAKDDLMSLSRKSSFTLTHSPNLVAAINFSRPDNGGPLDEMANQGRTLPKNLSEDFKKPANILPPRPRPTNTSLLDMADMYEYDECFPLPEPPLDIELLCLDHRPKKPITSSKENTLNDEYEETVALSIFDYLLPCIVNGIVPGGSFLNIKNCIYTLGVPTLFMNMNYFCELDQRSEIVLYNDITNIRQDNDYDCFFIDNKLESSSSSSDMLPLTQLEAIISPYDGANNYMSDNSDNSILSDNNFSLRTAYFNYVNTPLHYLTLAENIIDQIIPKNVFPVEHRAPCLRSHKEMTTSEVSEISETSQWISNEEKIVNRQVDLEESSFVNSLSEIPKSGTGCLRLNVARIHDTNNCKCDHTVTKWTSADQHNVSMHDTGIERSLTKVLCKQRSGEYEICSDSCQSISFPDPPTDLTKISNEIYISTNKGNLNSKEESKLKVSKTLALKTANDMVLSNCHGNMKSSSCAEMKDIIQQHSSDELNQVPSAYFKSCVENKEPRNIPVYISMNKPTMASTEICHYDRQLGFEPDKLTSLQTKKSSTNPTITHSKSMKVSLQSLLTDSAKLNFVHRKRLQGKRRSLSQSLSNNIPYNFDSHYKKNYITDLSYKSMSHMRAHSESDHQRINPEENVPTKQERQEQIRQNSQYFTPKISTMTKESILSRPITTGNTKDSTATNIAAWKRRHLIGLKQKTLPLITVHGDGLRTATVGKATEFFIGTSGHGIEDISLAVDGPSKIEIETINLPNGDCKVKYVPQSSGEYLLTIKQSGTQILGSPFKIYVQAYECLDTALPEVSPSLCAHADGQGLTNAYTNYPNQFIIYTKDSGPGGLSLSIEGPSKATIEFQDAKNGACGVTYRVADVGLYTCIVKFNKSHIKNSPFSINVTSLTATVTNTKETKSTNDKVKPTFQIGKRAVFRTELFNIDTRNIFKLVAILCCPLRTKKQLVVHRDQEKDLIWVEFIPHLVGSYQLHFMDESQRNEPLIGVNSFVLIVTEPSDFDQVCFDRELRSIRVYGKGLIKGRARYTNVFFIEIGESVSGALNVTVDGPSKVEIKCNETDKGFKFSYIPCIPGDYLVTIKYGGEQQIKGSPFQVTILPSNKGHNAHHSRRRLNSSPISQSSITELSTDLSNDSYTVTCFGSGISQGKINTWMDFYVDTSKTKTMKHLLVGIIGPSEPCDEIRNSYAGNQRYLISYKAREKGRHSVIIRWGEHHIKGSPGTIEID